MLLVGWLVAFTAACERPEPIREYSIRMDVPEVLVAQDRMLGLIVPQAPEVWFFKVVGPDDAIEYAAPTIRQFLRDLTFADGRPDLEELPAGWQLGTARPMREATLMIDTPTRELELAISRLPKSGGWDDQVSMNVNRWRGQLDLADSDQPWAGGEPFEVVGIDGDEPAIWVDLTGELGAGPGAMSGPMSGMAGQPSGSSAPPIGRPAADVPPPSPSGSPASPSANSDKLKYDVPEGWRDGKMSMMRLAAFNIGPAERPAELTIIPAGGDVRGNVDRWIGQVRGEQPPADVVDAALAAAVDLQVSGRQGQRFFLEPADGADDAQAIDATIVPLEDGMSLFIKATGPAETLGEERQRIGEFLESISLVE